MQIAIYCVVIVLFCVAVVAFFLFGSKKEKKKHKKILDEEKRKREENSKQPQPSQPTTLEKVETVAKPTVDAEFEDFSLKFGDGLDKDESIVKNKKSKTANSGSFGNDLNDFDDDVFDKNRFDDWMEKTDDDYDRFLEPDELDLENGQSNGTNPGDRYWNRRRRNQNYDDFMSGFDDEHKFGKEMQGLGNINFDDFNGKSAEEIEDMIKDYPPRTRIFIRNEILRRKKFEDEEN